MRKIGFFGDSFVKDFEPGTYISKLVENLKLQVVNLGIGGSSIEDTILKQFSNHENDLPDICVFSWTVEGRLYHPTVRNLNILSVDQMIKIEPKNGIYKAASWYYAYLYNLQASRFRYCSMLSYFDRFVLSNLSPNIRIIHMWSFGQADGWSQDTYSPENIIYPYRFTTGVEIRPSLISLATFDRPINEINDDTCYNHLNNEEKNRYLYAWIIDALRNYEKGRLIDESKTIQLKRKN